MSTAIDTEGCAPGELHQAVPKKRELKHRDRIQLYVLLHRIGEVESPRDLLGVGKDAINGRIPVQSGELRLDRPPCRRGNATLVRLVHVPLRIGEFEISPVAAYHLQLRTVHSGIST